MLRFLALIFVTTISLSASAITIPKAVQQKIFALEPGGHFRFDGIYEKGNQNWLLLSKNIEKEAEAQTEILEIEISEEKTTAEKVSNSQDIIDEENQDYLIYHEDKAYLYTPIKDNTIKSFQEFSPAIQEEILSMQISPEFLIPAGFSISRDLAIVSQELPIKFRNVQLATEKEEIFQTILKEQKAKEFNFLAYSSKSNNFSLYKFNKENSSVEEKFLGAIALENKGEELEWVSNIKNFKDKVYISEYNSGKIYEIKNKDIINKDSESLKLKTYKDLKPLIQNNGLLDFSLEHKTLFFLSQKDSRLNVINASNNKVINVVRLPNLVTEMEEYDFISSEAKNLIVNSRGSNQLNFVSTANYQIVHSISYKQDKRINFIHDFAINKDMLITASEIYENDQSSGSLIIYSSINKELLKELKLDFIPEKVLFFHSDQKALVMGFNGENSVLAKVNLENLEISQKVALDADLAEAKEILLLAEDKLLAISSKTNPMLVFLDSENLETIKKVPSKNVYDKIVYLE
ncbi:MAG: hypothetical protein MK033_05430 [Candidatus Caenarcaniphilales bacterium]|nr:hypothetical protein [Candidatus Caenarcaniphilales bacterium]